MDEVKRIVTDINNGNIKPLYFLFGEESYYIDAIASHIEKNVLQEEEKGFNQMVLYGKDVTIDDIVSNAENPQPTTVLVICYKYKKIDKRKKLYKTVKECGVVFESKKLYENRVPDWIRKHLQAKGYSISHKAAILLSEYLGTDLSRINNELEKLQFVLAKKTEITPEDIETHIGISKDYNNFELKNAIGERDMVKATRIINYFAQNPKDNPFMLTVALLNTFFTQLLQYHGLNDHSPKSVSSALRINPYFVDEIQVAARNYPMKRVSGIVSHLREMDMKGKGVGANAASQSDLLKELLTGII